MEKKKVCKSCHWGRALVAGLTVGLSGLLLLRTKKGEKLTTEGKKAAQKLQQELMKMWKHTEHFSKTEYDAMVKEIVGRYQRTKGMAVDEVADLEEFLMGQWETIQKKLLK